MNRPNGNIPVAGKQASEAQGYDFVGALVRRKWIMLPFIVAGLLIGYFYYTKQPPVYASTLKLMIWTQSPPTFVNGEAMVQTVSVGKHQNLLTSQVVLNNAVKEGSFGDLKTFKGNPFPLAQLKGSLTAAAVDRADDTLLLTARGPDPEELPTILSSVVAAYQKIINEDTAAVGKESVDLIAKFQDRIVQEKSAAEKRLADLIQKLHLSSDPRMGLYMNPNLLRVDQLKTQIAGVERSYREILDRIDSLTDIQRIASEKRSELLKVVAMEAAKYLSLKPEEDPATSEIKQEQDDRHKLLVQLGDRIDVLESKVSDLRLKRSQLKLKDIGEQHPEVLSVRTDLDFYGTQLTALIEQQQKLRSSIQTDSIAIDEKTTKQTSSSPLSLSEYDKELIKIYYASLKRESERLKKSIEGIEEEVIKEDQKAAEIGVEIGELNRLTIEIKDKDGELRGIVDKLAQIATVATNYTSTKIRVIDNPGTGYQIEPSLSKILLTAGFLGALVGFGMILLLDWADMSFRSPSEIQDKLGIPVVGRIPFIEKNKGKIIGKAAGVLSATKQTSAANEAYRSCRTAMLFLAKEHNAKTILVTSPSAGDGKSTTAANLAICFSQAGYKTVLVDADLRRPRCHVYLGETKTPGLKDMVAGSADYHSLIKPCKDYENLSLIASGGHPSNPTEFLESVQFKKLLTDLKTEFDFVVIDSPPVLPVADATALSTMCDMVFIVLRIRRGVELASMKAIEILRMVDGNVLGVIVNGVDKKSYYSDYGKYGYNGYGGYRYYATRYYEKDNEKYYKAEQEKVFSDEV